MNQDEPRVMSQAEVLSLLEGADLELVSGMTEIEDLYQDLDRVAKVGLSQLEARLDEERHGGRLGGDLTSERQYDTALLFASVALMGDDGLFADLAQIAYRMDSKSYMVQQEMGISRSDRGPWPTLESVACAMPKRVAYFLRDAKPEVAAFVEQRLAEMAECLVASEGDETAIG